MKKILKIKQLKTNLSGDIVFYIEEQSHRGKNFGKNSEHWHASNGYELTSSAHPEVTSHVLFVCGCAPSQDHKKMICSPATYNQILEAINEYNLFFSGKKIDSQDEYIRRMGISL